MSVIQQLKGLFAEGHPEGVPERVTTETSTRSAGAQAREEGERGPRKGTGAKRASEAEHGQAGATVPVQVRLRRPVVEAVAVAVRDSPIEFGTPADFYRQAIANELQRRGLLKSFK